MRLTRRFIIKSLDGLNLSDAVRYERYYINDNLRVQRKGDKLEKEILNEKNDITEKIIITEKEFENLKKSAYSEIIRDSYLYLKDNKISIKKYYGIYSGLNRIEVEFHSIEEMNNYTKENWMEEEITDSPLAFDKFLSKLSQNEFLVELEKYLK